MKSINYILNIYYPELSKSEYDEEILDKIIEDIKQTYTNIINDISFFIFKNLHLANLYEYIIYNFPNIKNKNIAYIYSNLYEKTNDGYIYNPLIIYITNLKNLLDIRILDLLSSSINKDYYTCGYFPLQILFNTLKNSSIISDTLCKKIISDENIISYFLLNFYKISNNCKDTIKIYLLSIIEICNLKHLDIEYTINYKIIKLFYNIPHTKKYYNKYKLNDIIDYSLEILGIDKNLRYFMIDLFQ